MQTRKSYIDLGKLGSLDNRIPLLSIGKGKPEISIMWGVHGDESAGFFITHYLIERLKSFSDIKGTINLISAVSPLALINNTRVSTLDYLDLNRVGKGDPDGSYTERVACRLFEFLKSSDLVLDLHEFQTVSPILAINMHADETNARKRTLEAILAFAPKAVWSIDGSRTSEQMYDLTMMSVLLDQGTANFIIEMSSINIMTDEEINNVVSGILRILGFFGLINFSYNVLTETKAYFREKVTANSPGLFIPKKRLLSKIEKGDIVGNIIHYGDYTKENVCSCGDGILLQILNRKLVDTGSTLFSIGSDDHDLNNRIQLLQTKRRS